MRLLLVRHGESEGNIKHTFQEREDPLTARGRRQGRELAAYLSQRDDISAIYTSPLARAFETAQIIGAATGLAPESREGLVEIDTGEAAGIGFQEWEARFPDIARRFHDGGIDFTFPGGESARQLCERTATEIARIVERHHADPGAVIVVSHGGALAWILAFLAGEPRDAWPPHRFDNCSITEVEIDPNSREGMTFICRNEVGHLSPEPEIHP